MNRWTAGAAVLLASSLALAQRDGPPPVPAFEQLAGEDLGLHQKAWRNPEKNIGPGQHMPGYRMYTYHWGAVYPIRTRFAMSTTIRLDPRENILDDRSGIVLADTTSFGAVRMRPNAIEVRPKQGGVDTTLKLYTTTGRVYAFYLVSETAEGEHVSDVIVDVLLSERGRRTAHRSATHPAGSTPRGQEDDWAIAPKEDEGAGWTARDERLFGNLRSIGFDPANVRFDLKAFGSSEEAIRHIGPEEIFRDLQWTYIRYPTKAASMQDWPVAMLLSQGTEIPVGTRVAGDARDTLVVEAVGDIVLRSGEYVICIRIDNGPRGPMIRAAEKTVLTDASTRPPARQEFRTQHVEVRIEGIARNDLGGVTAGEIVTAQREEQVGDKVHTVLRTGSWGAGNRICQRANAAGHSCTVDR